MPKTISSKSVEMSEESMKPPNRPAATLLKAWGKRMAKGNAVVIPVYVGGSWSIKVPRGNKRFLCLQVPAKAST